MFPRFATNLNYEAKQNSLDNSRYFMKAVSCMPANYLHVFNLKYILVMELDLIYISSKGYSNL